MITTTMSRRRFERPSRVVFCTVALGLLSSPWNGSAGEIYKSVDSRGQVTYSDKPSPLHPQGVRN